jgi:hypothetical protein
MLSESLESAGSTESDETAGTMESYCYHSGSEILSSYEASSRLVTPMNDDSRKWCGNVIIGRTI